MPTRSIPQLPGYEIVNRLGRGAGAAISLALERSTRRKVAIKHVVRHGPRDDRFIQQAEKDGNQGAKRTFQYANEVEKIHYQLYNRATGIVEKGEDLPDTRMFVCRGCGNTVEGEPPEKCPICGAPRKMFMEIE